MSDHHVSSVSWDGRVLDPYTVYRVPGVDGSYVMNTHWRITSMPEDPSELIRAEPMNPIWMDPTEPISWDGEVSPLNKVTHPSGVRTNLREHMVRQLQMDLSPKVLELPPGVTLNPIDRWDVI